ncbi:hypothetical protein Tco_0287693 [Tanacetum coccineum]
MSTSNVHQQSLADAGSETRPPMLERESTPVNEAPRMQKEEDLSRDDLKHYEAEIEAMNLILISIPNDIYNSVDACTPTKSMWERVERLMRGTVQNQVDRVTQVPTTEDSYDDLFDYLQQFKKLVNASRAKKLEKTHDPLALVAHMGSSPELLHSDRVNIQSKNSGNDGRNTRRTYVQEEVSENTNVQNDAGIIQRNLRIASTGTVANMLLAKQDEVGFILTDEQNDFFFSDASWMEEIKELSENICLMVIIQPANIDSEARPSYNSAFLSEVQTPSTSYVNPLFDKDDQEQHYLTQPKILTTQFDTTLLGVVSG